MIELKDSCDDSLFDLSDCKFAGLLFYYEKIERVRRYSH